MPHVYLLDRTPPALWVVADDGGMVTVAKVVAMAALDSIHLDGVAGRYTTVNLPDGAGEAVSVPLLVQRAVLPSVRARLWQWQRQLISFKCKYKI